MSACQVCGMHLDDGPAVFHPYIFCVLVKAGRSDPWRDLCDMNGMLGIYLPERPPLVRDLPLKGGKP